MNKIKNSLRKTRKVILFPIYVVFCLFITLVIAETTVRLYVTISKKDINTYRPSFFFTDNLYSTDRNRFMSHPFLPFISRPNDKRTIHMYKPLIKQNITIDYQNNSLGFRTPERAFTKEAGVKRIVTLGGSTTWDGPTNETTWPALLEKRLNDYYGNKNPRIEVINLAVDAAVSQMSLNILEMFGLHYEPDLVLSYDGYNDNWPTYSWTNIVPDYSNYIKPFNDKIFSTRTGLPKWAFHSYAVSFITYSLDNLFKFKTNLPDQVWQQSPTNTPNTLTNGLPLFLKNIKLMKAICREYNCNFVASTPHWVDTPNTVFIVSSIEFFKKEKINFLDAANLLPHNDFSIHTDEIHWTEKGTNMMADIWAKKIIDENLLSLGSKEQVK